MPKEKGIPRPSNVVPLGNISTMTSPKEATLESPSMEDYPAVSALEAVRKPRQS